MAEGVHADLHEGVPPADEESVAPAPCHHLYMFIDPRNKTPIYVGITMYLQSRLSAHMTSSESAVGEWSRQNGVDPQMILIASFPTRDAARRAEERLIAFVPSLTNRDVQATRSRVLHGATNLRIVA